jgi:hypothetical protein
MRRTHQDYRCRELRPDIGSLIFPHNRLMAAMIFNIEPVANIFHHRRPALFPSRTLVRLWYFSEMERPKLLEQFEMVIGRSNV